MSAREAGDHDHVTAELLRIVFDEAQAIRSDFRFADYRLPSADAYSLCFHLARRLRARLPDIRIMVGDRVSDRGPIQHLWLEFPNWEIFVDIVADEIDPFHPVRVGRTSQEFFRETYRNGQDGNFDLDDPRNQPELLFKTKSAWDPEAPE